MYTFNSIQDQIIGATNAQDKTIVRYGVYVYADTDPDDCSPDFTIDPADTKGLEIFREFAAKMAEHYKTLNP